MVARKSKADKSEGASSEVAQNSSKRLKADKNDRLKNYDAVVQSAELEEIILVDSKFEIKPEYFSIDVEKRSFEIEKDMLNPLYISDSGNAVANFTWKISTKSGRKKVLKLSCNYLCVYQNLFDMEEDAVIAFVRRVGQFAVYPYFRSFVSQISWACNADLPLLPILREQKRGTPPKK